MGFFSVVIFSGSKFPGLFFRCTHFGSYLKAIFNSPPSIYLRHVSVDKKNKYLKDILTRGS